MDELVKGVVEKPQQDVAAKKYHVNIDILRIVASFMVVMLHVSADKWYSLDATSSEWAALNLYDSAVRSCVPLFFMISGMLFLDRDKMVSTSKLFKNNILKLAVMYVVWVIFYAVITIGIEGLLTPEGIGNLVQLMKGDSRYHLWFLPALIGVYLLMPILFALKDYKDGKYVLYTLVLFFVFGIVLETLRVIPIENNYLMIILNKARYELVGYSGYFLLGYYLSKKDYAKIPKTLLVAMLLLIIGAATVIGRNHAVSSGSPSGLLYGYMALPVFLEAVLIFVIFLKIKSQFSVGVSEKIAIISKCTLGVYLIHPVVIEYLQKWFGLSTISFNTWFAVPVISLIVFVVGVQITMILRKIPLVKKWLV